MRSNDLDTYQYGSSARKLKPVEKKRKKSPSKAIIEQKVRVKKVQKRKKVIYKNRLWIGIFCVFISMLAISIRTSLINEQFTANLALQDKLGTIEKENEQLRVNIENSLSLVNIESLAKERLGMQKLDESQKIYVSLPKKDYVEAHTEEIIIEEQKSLLDTILEKLNIK